jgi:hypothetical protein
MSDRRLNFSNLKTTYSLSEDFIHFDSLVLQLIDSKKVRYKVANCLIVLHFRFNRLSWRIECKSTNLFKSGREKVSNHGEDPYAFLLFKISKFEELLLCETMQLEIANRI